MIDIMKPRQVGINPYSYYSFDTKAEVQQKLEKMEEIQGSLSEKLNHLKVLIERAQNIMVQEES